MISHLVKYSCGCVGLPPQEPEKSIILWDCRSDERCGTQHTAGYRNMKGKSYEVIPEDQELALLDGLATLIGKAVQYDIIRGALGIRLTGL